MPCPLTCLMTVSAASRNYVPTRIPPNLQVHTGICFCDARLSPAAEPSAPRGRRGWCPPIALFGTSLPRTPSSPVSGKSALLRAFPAPGHDIHASWVSVPTALTPQAFPGPAWLSPTPAWLPSRALSTEHSSPIHQVWYARFAGCLTRGGLVSRVRSEAPWRRGTGLSRS